LDATVLADPHEKRPIMMCEYAYAKGNSTGNFFKFWDMVDTYPRFQGGCIWDWNDKAILHTAPTAKQYYAYGGDLAPTLITSASSSKTKIRRCAATASSAQTWFRTPAHTK
jgi:hypothetical protein